MEAKTQLLQNVSSLKRNQETANLLARLLPEGGRAAKMRRSVSHLSEVLVLGALAAGGKCRPTVAVAVMGGRAATIRREGISRIMVMVRCATMNLGNGGHPAVGMGTAAKKGLA